MNAVLVVLLLLVGFISFVPVINMNSTKGDSKYVCLKYLMNVTFVWTLLIFLERLAPTNAIIYYAHMLGYPLKFLLSILMVCTIFNYIERKMPRIVIYVAIIIFISEFIVAISNDMTLYFVRLELANMTSVTDLYDADKGILFIVHLILSYGALLSSVVFLFSFLAKHRDVRQYQLVTRTMAISVVVVLLFNLVQLVAIKTDVDLTYMSLVIVSYALYQAIYKKDMVFNLKASGRGEILSNMREIYILTDSSYNVIEISNIIVDKYKVDASTYIGKHLNTLKEALEQYMVFYSEYQVNEDEEPNKDHYHMREKKFQLKGMNDFGYMILLYDETQVFQLLRELNKLSNFDNMTGLNNRNFMENKLETIGLEENIGVISLDLNGLKANNDYLGHERGDYLLKSLANKIKIVMSSFEHKYMARIGGDEFLVLISNSSNEQVMLIKEKILDACNSELIEEHVSVSIGTAVSNGQDSIYAIIQEADVDMYKMKSKTSKEYSKRIVEYAQQSGKYIR